MAIILTLYIILSLAALFFACKTKNIGIICGYIMCLYGTVSSFYNSNLNPFGVIISVGLLIISYSHYKSISEYKRLSFYDNLTGLYNYRYFADEVSRLQSSRKPVTVLVADVDDLKEVNDNCGHQRGDELIESVGRVFSSCTRESDIAARIGGDEFGIILPGAKRETAEVIADRIRRKCKEKGIDISIGIAVRRSCSNMERAVDKADRRMYENKREGRC